jgi:hypothetical protein
MQWRTLPPARISFCYTFSFLFARTHVALWRSIIYSLAFSSLLPGAVTGEAEVPAAELRVGDVVKVLPGKGKQQRQQQQQLTQYHRHT